MTCSNNLKQISLAAHNYESSYGVLPPGYYGQYPNVGYDEAGFSLNYTTGVGTLVAILPYIEQNNLYTQFPQADIFSTPPSAAGYFNDYTGYSSSWNAAQVKIKTYLCPSDVDVTPTSTVYCYASGTELLDTWYWPGWNAGLAKCNYTGVMGTAGDRAVTSSTRYGPGFNDLSHCGIFNNRSKTSIVSITDGTSNTLMFGEGIGQFTNGSLDYAWNWVNIGPMPTRRGIPTPTNPLTVGVNQFYSRHTGIVQFSMGDGSVRSIRPGSTAQNNPASQDWYTLQSLAGKSDGDVISSNGIIN